MIIDDDFKGIGKIGDCVVYDHRGQKCVRRIGKSQCPPTPAQLAQRGRMASVAIFYRALKAAGIFPYWETAAIGKKAHGYNLLCSANLQAFNWKGAISDFAKLRLTPDLLPLPDGLSLVREADGAWRLEWAVVPGLPGAADDDYLKVFLMRDGETFNPECIVAGDACRADGRAVFRVPEALDDYRHLFIVFCSQAGDKCSESRYYNLLLCNTLKP